MHAREWISVSSAVYLIEKLVKDNTAFTSEVEWRIVPIVNPDGYKYSWNGVSTTLQLVKISKQNYLYAVDLVHFTFFIT